MGDLRKNINSTLKKRLSAKFQMQSIGPSSKTFVHSSYESDVAKIYFFKCIVPHTGKNSKILHSLFLEYTSYNISLTTMQIFLSIFFNGLILYGLSFFLPEITATGGLKLYFVAGILLGLLNTFVKPILKILGFPFVILTFGLFSLVINGVILALLQKAIEMLNIVGVTYNFGGWVNFAIAVVIFSIFNTLYGTFFKR